MKTPRHTFSHPAGNRIAVVDETLAQVSRSLHEVGMGRLIMRDSGEAPTVGVALSGGADSVALLRVALMMGWKIRALHCNFGLRGEESDRDEAFCCRLCEQRGVSVEVMGFDVRAYCAAHPGKSVEMACRELRYEWWNKLLASGEVDFIALGHHADDNVETLVLNLLRGCGLNGAKGMPAVREGYVRPLLRLTRRNILEFLSALGQDYITDSSNLTDDYKRNRIRHHVLPALERVDSNAIPLMANSQALLSADLALFREMVSDYRRRFFVNEECDLRALKEAAAHASTLLYHILEGDVDAEVLRRLLEGLPTESKVIEGRAYTYIYNKGALKKYPLGVLDAEMDEVKIAIPEHGEAVYHWSTPMGAYSLRVRVMDVTDFRPERNAAKGWFDAEALQSLVCEEGALVLRSPRTGDRMAPFGMKGTRLVSDILTEAHFSPLEKRFHPLLATPSGTILWVSGLKNSRHFPVSSATKRVLELEISQS